MKNKIREIVESKNIKISQLIKETGISKSYLYDLMSGNSVRSLINARKISEVINVDIEDIFPENNIKQEE